VAGRQVVSPWPAATKAIYYFSNWTGGRAGGPPRRRPSQSPLIVWGAGPTKTWPGWGLDPVTAEGGWAGPPLSSAGPARRGWGQAEVVADEGGIRGRKALLEPQPGSPLLTARRHPAQGRVPCPFLPKGHRAPPDGAGSAADPTGRHQDRGKPKRDGGAW